MLCLNRLIRIGLLTLLVSGCQTGPMPQGWQGPAAVQTETVPEPMPVAVATPLTPVQPRETNEIALRVEAEPLPPQVDHPWPKEWVNVWLPLESWGKFNGLGRPTQVSSGTGAVFQLPTTNGIVLVKMGSHTANLGGLEYGLGFAPRLIGGLPYIHSLDAQKTFQVLLGALLAKPATGGRIVIDAGHGGRDSGARSVIGHELEKQFTLDWALRLERRLVKNGWQVLLTRTNDTDVPLAQRVALANRVNPVLFISLHFNSGGPRQDLTGIETYCLSPTGMPSSIRRDDDDDVREMHPNNQFDDQNVQLATRLHRSLLQATGAVDRGVRRARFMAVLRGQKCPAVLIEGGYLTNPQEAKKVATADYREALAEGVAGALLP